MVKTRGGWEVVAFGPRQYLLGYRRREEVLLRFSSVGRGERLGESSAGTALRTRSAQCYGRNSFHFPPRMRFTDVGVFYKLKARPSTSTKITILFIAILA